MEEVLHSLEKTVKDLASDGKIPVCLGGEHTLTLAPVRALASLYPRLSVICLDAHADLRDTYQDDRLSHACVLRRIHDLGLPLAAVGVRSLSEPEARFISEHKPAVYGNWDYPGQSYPAEEISDCLTDKVYITVDLDAFDPSQVPEVGTPEPGGITWETALRLFRAVRDSGRRVVGFDLVELCPRADSEISSFFAARLLYKMIGYFG